MGGLAGLALELEIHFSEISSYLRCEQQHFKKYVLKLAKVGDVAVNLAVGKLFHGMAQQYHESGMTDALSLWEAETGGYDFAAGDWRLLPGMLGEYVKWYKESGYKVLLAEKELRVPYVMEDSIAQSFRRSFDVTSVTLIGTIDRLYLDASGQYWIGEDKTTTQISGAHLLSDPQGLTYMLFADELGLPVEGVLYVQVRKANVNTARVPMVKDFPIPFADDAKRFQARQLDRVLPRVIYSKLAERESVEPSLVYRLNPLPWMRCYCDFEDLCAGEIHGRDTSSLYETVDKVR